ncbi:hypothetical protein LOD99_15282 [Oopsacas minuta]|uniref:Gustatory receptor n=1 Tax=Oopsacas minuta TaxID=111878 RepID=A0AAV7KBD9_9METZ|nr:hypothetical protein LOD99_15282 [Oopsacas minuta]
MKQVPFQEYRRIDLYNIMKNLQTKNMVCNFILILIGLELLKHTLYFCGFAYRIVSLTPIRFEINQEAEVIVWNVTREMLSMSVIVQLMIVPTVSIILRILPLAYYNYPYRDIVKRWSVYIVYRSAVYLMLSHVPFIWNTIPNYFRFCIYLTDWVMYWYYARRFYLVLKGRRIEAIWHSTPEDYREKTQVQFQFLFTSILFGITSATLIIKAFSEILLTTIVLVLELRWTLDFEGFTFEIDSPYLDASAHNTIHVIFTYIFYIGFYGFAILHQVLYNLIYLGVFVIVINNILVRCRDFRSINKSIAPIIAIYHSTLKNS